MVIELKKDWVEPGGGSGRVSVGLGGGQLVIGSVLKEGTGTTQWGHKCISSKLHAHYSGRFADYRLARLKVSLYNFSFFFLVSFVIVFTRQEWCGRRTRK